jgi:uridine kinase
MKPSLIVGIAGGSGSGKTTLASGLRELTADCGSQLISQDDYYRGLPEGTAPEAYNFDDPAALDLAGLARDLTDLKAGRTVNMPTYDFAQHRRSPAVRRVDPAPLIIVEGLFIFVTPMLREVFDLRLFVDVPAEERLRRRLQRDARERGRTVQDILEQWNGQVEPMFVAHTQPTRTYAHVVVKLPHPDDHAYCEQVIALWRTVEDRLHGSTAD